MVGLAHLSSWMSYPSLEVLAASTRRPYLLSATGNGSAGPTVSTSTPEADAQRPEDQCPLVRPDACSRTSPLSLLWPAHDRWATPAAHAVTPSNDRIQHAKEVTALPYRDEIDTSDATSSATDPDCFGKVRTVWYEYTAPSDGQIAASTFGSGYNTNLAVYVGEPSIETQMACVTTPAGK